MKLGGGGEVTRKNLICTAFCPAIHALDINVIAHAYFYVITFKILENVPKLKRPCPIPSWIGWDSCPTQIKDQPVAHCKASCQVSQRLYLARVHACFLRAAFFWGGWGGGDLETCSLMGKGAVCSLSGEVTHSDLLPWLSCFQ